MHRGLAKVMELGVALMATLCVGVGHGAPSPTQMSTRYSPLHPPNNEPVSFHVKAENAQGISKVKLYIYEYEWENLESVIKRSRGTWGLVKTWDLPSQPTSVEKTHQGPGFPANSFVSYIMEVFPAQGAKTNEYRGFAAGDWSFSPEPIPLWIAPPLRANRLNPVLASTPTPATDRINVLFIAQTGDYGNPRAMLGDLHDLIFKDFLSNPAIQAGKKFWAFHYSPEQGTISPYSPNPQMLLKPSHTEAVNVGANLGVIVHTSEFQDWRDGRFFGTQPGTANFGTTLHEIGHAAFHLKDEYHSVQHAESSEPYHNNYHDKQGCGFYNIDNGWLYADCEPIDVAKDWWRPEPTGLNCVMRVGKYGPANETPHFARSCMLRVQWFYSQLR